MELAELTGVVQGLVQVVKDQQQIQKEQQRAQIDSSLTTNEHFQELAQSLQRLASDVSAANASPSPPPSSFSPLRLPNLVLPEYKGSGQNLERFLEQLRNLLHSAVIPSQFWLTYLKQQCQKDSQAYDAILDAEIKTRSLLGNNPTAAPEELHLQRYDKCVELLQTKCGKPRDQRIRELLAVFQTMKQQPRESVASFAHRFTETQHELEKLIPGIHHSGGSDDNESSELKLIYSFINKVHDNISKELVSREINFTSLQSVISAALRYESTLNKSGFNEFASSNSLAVSVASHRPSNSHSPQCVSCSCSQDTNNAPVFNQAAEASPSSPN